MLQITLPSWGLILGFHAENHWKFLNSFMFFPGNHNLNELPASRQPQDEKEVHQQKRRAADGYACTGDQPTTQDNFGGMTMISSYCHIKVVTSLVS